jgi:hypothetical protein
MTPSRIKGSGSEKSFKVIIDIMVFPSTALLYGNSIFKFESSGGGSLTDAVKKPRSPRKEWDGLLKVGCPIPVSVTLFLAKGLSSKPETGAGCGNTARPDL